MTTEQLNYPLYRKYLNEKSFFKILSPTEFEEIIETGGKYFLNRFTAVILPDYNLIQDMTLNYEKHWKVISEREYVEKLMLCKKES